MENISGINLIKQKLKNIPTSSGVYRMLDADGNVLYVGKAKNLKNRITNYTVTSGLSYRIALMVSLTHNLEIITTKTEAEALILENELIKKLKPKYNILLRDDKTYPYLLITNEEFPKIKKHRGKQNIKGKYFGPFASVLSLNESLTIIQKIFRLRTCSDSIFKNRTRACMLHQIKRCSAPCTNKISKSDYLEQVNMAIDFLSGKTNKVQKDLSKKMQTASQNMQYEQAAIYRDIIQNITKTQSSSNIDFASLKDSDIIAIYQENNLTAIQVFFYRNGASFGNLAFFPKQTKDHSQEQILEAFISSFYIDKIPPKEILISHKIDNAELLSTAIAKVKTISKNSKIYPLIERAIDNAKQSLKTHIASTATWQNRLKDLCKYFDIKELPNRIETYDNSHTSGTNSIGAMIVASNSGFNKKEYRTFNIKSKDINHADDFGMMKEVLYRRLSKITPQNKPDIILIDGGIGQLNSVIEIATTLNINDIFFIAIAKGEKRNDGKETFHTQNQYNIEIPYNSPARYFLQNLRDEAHRFAITTHRKKRLKTSISSELDNIDNIGAKRKKALLNHFGGIENIKQATIKDLTNVDGISKKTAEKIYNHFHLSN